LSGTVTSTGSLTLGGTLSVTPSNFASQTANTVLAAPNGTAGTPTFRAIVAADVPTLNQNTTGTASNVTGTVAATNGGTGQTSYAVGDILYASTTSALSKLADVATGNALISGGVGVAPSYGKIGLTTHVSGTLPVVNGGTGTGSLPLSVLKGGTSISAATAGTDFVAPGTATTFTATQTFSGSTSVLGAVFNDAAEVVTVSATTAIGTIAYDVTTQSVLFYTTNASGNFTVNFRGSSGTTLNTLLATGQSVTVAFLVTNGATAFYNTTVQVDGVTGSITTRWQGGTAPTAGNANSVDAYVYTIIKTAASTFSVFASQTRFA
jgi:hypothetical protein